MDDAHKICRCFKLGEALSTVGAGLEWILMKWSTEIPGYSSVKTSTKLCS